MRASQASVVERLARIETLLEGITARLAKMEAHTSAVEAAQEATDLDYQKLKSKGAGLLLAVGVFAGAVGAGFDKIVARIFG